MKTMRSFFCRWLICALLCVAALPAPLLAQQSNARESLPPPDAQAAHTTDLEKLLRDAAARTAEYRSAFTDLAAEETKTIETYDENGKLKRVRRIVSDLIVYQSRLYQSSVSEYRNVREVDGKAVAGRDKRVMKLFERLAKAKSLDKELERVDQEGNRYDLTDRYTGMTLHQGLLLADDTRPAFRYEVTGREQLDGREVVVVRYQQVRQTPGVNIDFKVPDMLKGSEFLYHGRLWLDAETAQIRREVRELALHTSLMKDPLVVVSFDFQYGESRFGVLLPRRLIFNSFAHGHGRPPGALSLSLSTRMTFEYGAFSRFDIKVPEATITPPDTP